MRSRSFTWILLTGIGFALFGATSRANAQALGGCTPIPNPAANPAIPSQVCSTGLNSASMDAAYRQQLTPVWCWAASMEMILAFNNEDVAQKDIVTGVFGAAIPTALDPLHVDQYMNQSYTDSLTAQVAKVSSTTIYSGVNTPTVLSNVVSLLRSGQPLLIFTPTHAMVMTAIYYYADGVGNPVGVSGVVVRDPFPYAGTRTPVPGIPIFGHPGERVLSAKEYFTQVAVYSIAVK